MRTSATALRKVITQIVSFGPKAVHETGLQLTVDDWESASQVAGGDEHSVPAISVADPATRECKDEGADGGYSLV